MPSEETREQERQLMKRCVEDAASIIGNRSYEATAIIASTFYNHRKKSGNF